MTVLTIMTVLVILAVGIALILAARAHARGTLPPILPAVPEPGINRLTTVSIAQAIAAAEGWYVTNSLPRRLNNPGALKLDGHALTQFRSEGAGWDALYHQVELMITGQSRYYNPSMTWRQIAVIYTGGDNPESWARNVAAGLSVSPDTTLGAYAA